MESMGNILQAIRSIQPHWACSLAYLLGDDIHMIRVIYDKRPTFERSYPWQVPKMRQKHQDSGA